MAAAERALEGAMQHDEVFGRIVVEQK